MFVYMYSFYNVKNRVCQTHTAKDENSNVSKF